MNAVGSPQDCSIVFSQEIEKDKLLVTTQRALAAIDFYLDVPNDEIGVDEFEELALGRLKVLRVVEELKARNVPAAQFHSRLEKAIADNLIQPNRGSPFRVKGGGNEEQRNEENKRRDVTSHFILRAAYCHTEELRRWFLTQECHLFRHRLERLAGAGDDTSGRILRTFMQQSDVRFNRVSRSEKNRLKQKLESIPSPAAGNNSSSSSSSSSSTNTSDSFASNTYYRIPFVHALDLVAKRQCYVEAGFAYVPMQRMVVIVTAQFRATLSKSLTLASLAFHQTLETENDRILPLLKSMSSQYMGHSYGDNDNTMLQGDGLKAHNIESYVGHMPLCMYQLQSGLKRDHKLRHWGRLQYGLFLKGAGLSMEESLIFFQRQFTRIMTPEQFTKGYAYNIRHMYGKEGKRANYTPYNCKKIILGNPPQTGDHHGCPFRHYDAENLSALLQKLDIGTEMDRQTMLNHKRNGNFQLACVKHFEVMHPAAHTIPDISLEGVGNHPNAWFISSVSYNAVKNPKKDDETNSSANLVLVEEPKNAEKEPTGEQK